MGQSDVHKRSLDPHGWRISHLKLCLRSEVKFNLSSAQGPFCCPRITRDSMLTSESLCTQILVQTCLPDPGRSNSSDITHHHSRDLPYSSSEPHSPCQWPQFNAALPFPAPQQENTDVQPPSINSQCSETGGKAAVLI